MVYMATPATVGLILLLLHVSCVTSQSPPSFTVHPSSGFYPNGSPVSLRCEASPTTSMHWAHNGDIISSDSRRIVGIGYLNISSLNSDLTGSYSCLASNDVGTVVSANANIQITVTQANLPSRASPRIVTAQEHQPIAFDCGTIVTVPPFRHPLNWENYDPIFNFALTDEFSGFNRSLYIQDPTVSRHNNNVYECSYTNRLDGTIVSGFIRLEVQASTAPPPAANFIQGPQDLVVNVGEGAFFDCVVGGSPVPTVDEISWLVPPTLRDISRFTTVQEGRQVRLRDAQTTDAGTYTCVVTDVGERRATLTVREPPVVTPLPSFVRNTIYGAPFSLNCLATGRDVSWRWYHNGTLMEAITGRTLNILSTVEEDSGVYQCFAYNPAGNDSAVAVLRVSTQPATFTNRTLPPEQVAFVGQPFEFVCSATGAPPPLYYWAKNGVPLSNNSGFVVLMSGELRIETVAATHNGMYTCTATNRIGTREIGSVVTSSVLFAIVPTTISSPPLIDIPAQMGTSTVLPCNASFQPGASITYLWMKNSSPLTVNGRLSFVSNTSGDIMITNVQHSDAGEYMCMVITRYNQLQAPSTSSGVIRVTITTNPVGPVVFHVAATSTNISVSWYFPSVTTNPPTMYSIVVQEVTVASNGLQIAQDQSALAITNATVRNLPPFTLFSVRVVAVFSGGERVESDVQTVMTSEDRPRGPPTNVKVSVINETTLQVLWEPPDESLRNGLIVSYTLQFRPRDTGSFTSVSVGNDTRRLLLTGLTEKGLYDVRVAASTSVGLGPYSDTVVASTDLAGLRENPDPAFYQTTWFIVVIFLLALGLVTGAVVVVCVVRRRSTRGKAKKYHVRPASGYFGAGVKDVSLSEGAMMDYESRSSRFGSARGFEGAETESSLMGSHSTQYTPQLQMRLAAINASAPSYIDPPPFEEALKHRARPHSASTQPEITGTVSDWGMEQGSRNGLLEMHTTPRPHLAMELHANGPVQFDYADSGESDSAEKPSYSSLEGSEESPSQVSNAHSSPSTKYATFV